MFKKTRETLNSKVDSGQSQSSELPTSSRSSPPCPPHSTSTPQTSGARGVNAQHRREPRPRTLCEKAQLTLCVGQHRLQKSECCVPASHVNTPKYMHVAHCQTCTLSLESYSWNWLKKTHLVRTKSVSTK